MLGVWEVTAHSEFYLQAFCWIFTQNYFVVKVANLSIQMEDTRRKYDDVSSEMWRRLVW
jgi:hypothetical protein